MILALATILFPLLISGLAWAESSNSRRPLLLPIAGVGHLMLSSVVLLTPDVWQVSKWLTLDPPGRLVLIVISTLFCVSTFYAASYLRYRHERPNRIFCICFPGTIMFLTLATWSNHMGLMWVAIEATALATAPLIYFYETSRSIEATWKYLLIGFIGIALALLGSFFMAYALLHAGLKASLTFDQLLQNANMLSKPWLYAGFVLLLVGYGTKMGLAPMHTWKPDAYGEAPGVVGALMAGAVTSCAFLAIARVYYICVAAGESQYAGKLLIFIGLLSMAMAGALMLGQRDFKRSLAYSSVEHMGILVIGLGLGGSAIYAAWLHMINNALAKGVMFLSAGNIHRAYESKRIDNVTGAIRRLPLSGTLFLIGFIAIAGSPPFGPFVSIFSMLNTAFVTGKIWTGVLFLLFLLLVFIGMGATVLSVTLGKSDSDEATSGYQENVATAFPPLLLMTGVLLLGIYIPGPLHKLISQAATYMEIAQ